MKMNIFKSGLGIVLVVLAVVAMLASACGPSEAPSTQPTPSTSPTPSGNQPPEISSLTANPSGVSYGGSATVKCIATDPDGDVIDYSWSASGGDISGSGDTVTWIAPDKGGNFYISVILSDGKGGETTDKIMVTVSSAVSTVNITPIAEETGTARSDGSGDNFRTWAGDDEKDRGYCAFWSFDVQSLAGKNIHSASLKFTTKDVVGAPFPSTTGLGGKVTYSDGLPKFKYTGTNLRDVPLLESPPTVIDVTQEITNIAAVDVTRFQVEALFPTRDTNGNHIAQFIEWSDVVLEVTYSDK
jgi:hypothetical protein